MNENSKAERLQPIGFVIFYLGVVPLILLRCKYNAKNDIMGALQFSLPSLNAEGFQNNFYDNLPDPSFDEYADDYKQKYLAAYHKRSRSMCVTLDLSIRHFKAFQRHIGGTLRTSQINKEVLDEFVQFMIYDEELRLNTIQNFLQSIKRLLTRAQQNYCKVDMSFKESKIRVVHPFKIALSEHELAMIYCCKGLTKPQQEVRDLFILSCFTGLRYSDAARLSRHNIQGNMIKIMTQKTKATVLIPIFYYTREILEKYEYNLPKARCIQYFNLALKVVCKKVGLTRLVEYDELIGDKIQTISRPLYKEISSHTARRTFVTTMLRNGVDALVIKEITGHKSLASFAMYDKTTQIEKVLTIPMRGLFSCPIK